MGEDDLIRKLNRLGDEFKGDYDALLEAYENLKERHQSLKVTIILCIIALIYVLIK